MKNILHYINALAFLLIFIDTTAQVAERIPVDSFAFVRYENDTLTFSPDTSHLPYFFNKLDEVIRSKTGNINIMHIGGSHVQAGVFPHRIRHNILHNFPELIGRRGMIFPYSVAPKCNNPYDYRVSKNTTFSLVRNVYKNLEKPLGVTGIAVYTADSSAEIKISLNDNSLPFVTDRIVLLGRPDSSWTTQDSNGQYTYRIVPIIIANEKEIFPSSIDTLNERYIYNVESITDSFRIKINNPDSIPFTINGILLDNDRPGITYHSIGVNGACVNSYLKCEHFDRDLALLAPDLVIFGIGINDANGPNFDTLTFEHDYLTLIQHIKNVNPNCAFIFITNNDCYKRISRKKYTVNLNGPKVQRTFYRIAAQIGGAVWDQFDIMGGLRSMEKWRIAKLAQYDRIHFTNKGYTFIGDLFYNAFVEAWEKCKTIQENLPNR